MDESGERINPVHKPLMNFLITSKDLQKAGIPVSSEEKRFGFAPMRGKRFYNDLDFPIVRNNKRARFFGLRGKRVPSLEQKLSDEDFKNILGKLLNDAYDFSTNSNDAGRYCVYFYFRKFEKVFKYACLKIGYLIQHQNNLLLLIWAEPGAALKRV